MKFEVRLPWKLTGGNSVNSPMERRRNRKMRKRKDGFHGNRDLPEKIDVHRSDGALESFKRRWTAG